MNSSDSVALAELPGYLLLRTGEGWLPLVLRVYTGGAFLFEGARKFLDPGRFGISRFEALGFPFPGFFAPLVGGFEVACGALLLLGLGVRVAAFPPLTILLGALVLVRATDPAGAWYELTLAAACVVLLFRGGGAYSLDRRLWLARPQGQGSGTTG
jgi:putative oxidoreductase